jgi:phospholipase C
MGPKMPNRLYLHTGTSAGLKINDPIKVDPPKTIWEHLAGAGVSAKNYFAGRTAQIAHALPTKAKAGKIPVAKIDDFFTAAKNGTLPSVSFIDPEYGVNDDHPDHDVRLGQAFVKSVYKALAKSPQWSKSLLIVIYDEHGGFYDHVPPGVAPDEHEDFRRYGFRVPAMIAGPTVRTGYLATRRFDHTSVLATLAARFKLGHISKRTSNANLITHVLDPQREGRPAPPPLHPPPTRIDRVALATIGKSSQPEMDVAIDDGEVPAELVDQRTLRDRVESWLQTAEALGAVERDDAAHHWGEMSAPELSPSEL